MTLFALSGLGAFAPVSPSYADTADTLVYWQVGVPEDLTLPAGQQVYAAASDQDLAALIECLNGLSPGVNDVDCSRSGTVGVCVDEWCTGHYRGVTTTFTLYTIDQNWSVWEAECKPLMEGQQADGSDPFQAGRDCSVRVGCEVHSDTTATTLSVYCPFVASAPLGQLTVEQEGSAAQSTLGTLPVLGPPEKVVRDVAVSTGAALVLGVLALLPTQLINTTLMENRWILDRFRSKRRRTSEDPAEEKPTPLPLKVAKALLAFLVASIAVGFVDPNFGFTLNSLTVVATALLAFVVVNVVGTVSVWWFYQRRAPVNCPELSVHVGYLVVIVATVLISRLLNLEPVIVFGAILAIETGRVIEQAKTDIGTLPARMERSTGIALMTLGFLAWAAYQALSITSLNTLRPLAFAQQFLAAIAIETLATLPILLLPLTFLPGAVIFAWSKVRWAVVYVLGLTLFMFVLVPLPESWSETGSTLASWSLVLVAYGVFAGALWAVFAVVANRHTRSREPNSAGDTSE